MPATVMMAFMFIPFKNLMNPDALPEGWDRLPKKLWPFYWHFLKQDKRVWIWLAVLGIGANILDALQPLFVKQFVDLATAGPSAPNFTAQAVLVFALFVLLRFIAIPVMEYLNSMFTGALRPLFANKIRNQLFAYCLGQPIAYFEKDFAGRLSSKIMETPYAMVSFVTMLFTDVSWAFVLMGATLISMFATHWLFGCFTIAFFCVYFGLLKIFLPTIMRQSTAAYDTLSVARGHTVDSLSNILSVKLFARTAHEKETLRGYFSKVTDDFQIMNITNGWMRTLLDASLGTYLLACAGLSFYLVEHSMVETGSLALIWTMALRLSGALFWLLHLAGHLFENLGQIEEGMEALAVERDVQDKQNAAKFTPQSTAIAFNAVNFKYNSEDILRDFSLHIPSGQRVGLLGPSGAGKSTLVKLLLRLYDIQGGAITIDGQNIASVTQDSLRDHIAVIPQIPELLHRSIRDNIAYGKPDATDDEIRAAARVAQADVFIEHLEDHKGNRAYDALVGERGVKLSGGQRQRIALARAVLKNAPILILDEATASLDTESERAVQAGLEHLMQGRTVIAIAHRLSTIAHLDRLLVLEGGKVVEDGTHEELLHKNGLYARLWSMQSGNFLSADETAGHTDDHPHDNEHDDHGHDDHGHHHH